MPHVYTRVELARWSPGTLRDDALETLAALEEARSVLAKLLALPHAKYELSYLDRGIGTSTESAVWLDVRRIVERK